MSNQSNLKSKAKHLKKEALRFGYDIKNTHALELCAKVLFNQNRHSALVKEKNIVEGINDFYFVFNEYLKRNTYLKNNELSNYKDIEVKKSKPLSILHCEFSLKDLKSLNKEDKKKLLILMRTGRSHGFFCHIHLKSGKEYFKYVSTIGHNIDDLLSDSINQ